MDWDAHLTAYDARKTNAARAATIPGFQNDVVDVAGTAFDAVGDLWTRPLFDGPFLISRSPAADRPSVGLTLVQSSTGNTEAANPTRLGGGLTDLHLVYEGLTRVAADAVLAGAATARGGNVLFSVWHPRLVELRWRLGKPRHPIQIVASLDGNLNVEDGLLFNVPGAPVIVLTTASGASRLREVTASRPWVTLLGADAASDLRAHLAALAARGVRRISAIGGRHIATALLDAGCVQDLYLTTGTADAGAPGTPYYIGDRPPPLRLVLRKHGRDGERGVVFEHWRVESGPGAGPTTI